MKMIIMAGGTLLHPNAFKSMVSRADRVVCADGGAGHLAAMGILPHVVIGDLDSITPAHQSDLEAANVAFLRHPVDKDYTDTELAAQWAMDNGATEITFLGTTGTRLDHTLANILSYGKNCCSRDRLLHDGRPQRDPSDPGPDHPSRKTR